MANEQDSDSKKGVEATPTALMEGAQVGEPTMVVTSPEEAAAQMAGLVSQARDRARFAETAAERADDARSKTQAALEQATGVLAAAKELETSLTAVVQAATTAKENAEASLKSAEEARSKTQDESVEAAAARTEAQTNATASQQASQVAQGNLTQSAEHQQAAQQAASQAATALSDTQQQLTNATESVDKIASILEAATADQIKTQGLAKKAEDTKTTLKEYEDKLLELQNDYTGVKSQIEGLLPGATSAGLAHHFKDQKESYRTPKLAWAALFIAAVVGMMLTVLLVPQEEWVKNIANPYQGLLVSFLHRSPYFIPLGLLAYFAYRYYGLADRMEQDYAYKERLSSAFEGYKKQMSEIQVPPGQVSPFAGLCNNILHIIGQHPARFYDKHHIEEAPPGLSIGQLLDVQPAGKRTAVPGPAKPAPKKMRPLTEEKSE